MKLEFDASAFSVEAAQKAAYRRMSEVTVDIRLEGSLLICVLSAANGLDEDRFALSVQEFRKDILDEQLRLLLRSETEPVRNLILGIAFSNTRLVKQ
jgi:His-Xaa-Ser system protein HxsD